jgi:hypothetical protein
VGGICPVAVLRVLPWGFGRLFVAVRRGGAEIRRRGLSEVWWRHSGGVVGGGAVGVVGAGRGLGGGETLVLIGGRVRSPLCLW